MAFTKSGRVLLYNNNDVYLAGVLAGTGEGDDAKSTTDELIPPFIEDFKRLSNYKNNFHRHWLVPYWNYSPRNAVNMSKVVFRKDADGRWNLRSFNAMYLTRLVRMIMEAARQGVVVQLVLFDRCGLDTTLTDDAPKRRWPDSPWNQRNNSNGVVVAPLNDTSGIQEFFQNRADIRSVQENYIKQVVNKTKDHWNVFYEIMNEPIGVGTRDTRVLWADWVVGVIHSLTGGANMIFYNDHLGGVDVVNWKDKALPNYNKFHGVIFHGRPADCLLSNPAYEKFRNDKIFQVCSDGFTDTATEDADDETTNKAWTNHAFNRKMIYQAHTNQWRAARGIGAATIKPTQLV